MKRISRTSSPNSSSRSDRELAHVRGGVTLGDAIQSGATSTTTDTSTGTATGKRQHKPLT